MKITRWQWYGRVMLDRRLTAAARDVAFWMQEHANRETLESWPSVSTLEKLTGHPERTVQDGRAKLVKAGWLTLVRASRGPGTGAVYRLTLGVQPIAPIHTGVAAAERMYQGVRSDEGVQTTAPLEGAEGVQATAPTGADGCADGCSPLRQGVQTTAPKHQNEHRQEHHQDHHHQTDDGGGGFALDPKESEFVQIADWFVDTRNRLWPDAKQLLQHLVDDAASKVMSGGKDPAVVAECITYVLEKMKFTGKPAPSSPMVIKHTLADVLRMRNGTTS